MIFGSSDQLPNSSSDLEPTIGLTVRPQMAAGISRLVISLFSCCTFPTQGCTDKAKSVTIGGPTDAFVGEAVIGHFFRSVDFAQVDDLGDQGN
jgi:hypothetical protein